MNFEISNIENNGLSATMRINKPISSDKTKGLTGEMFTKEHDALVDSGVQNLLVTINSSGGNTFQGWEIFGTIAGSPMKTETQVVGVAASMAGVISQAGDKRTIKSNALFHAHSPRPEKGAKVGAGILNQVYNQIKTVFNENSSMIETDIVEMLNGETFFNANESIENGLFDEIIPTTGRVPKIEKTMNAADIMNVVNSFENKSVPAVSGKHKVQKMEKVNEMLSLSADAAESSTIEAVQKLQNSFSEVENINNELKEKNEGLKSQVEKMEAELAEINKTKAVSLIEDAIEAGKISVESQGQWTAKAIQDIENTKILLDSIKGATAKKIMDSNEGKGAEEVESATWGFEEWSMKNPEGLSVMQTENEARYNKLFNAYIDA